MDWNNDGKKDLISGDTKGQVWVFLNTGTDEAPELAEGVRVQAGGVPIVAARYATGEANSLMGTYSKLHYADWDGDGTNDLLFGTERPEIYFLRNAGTNEKPRLEAGRKIDLIGGDFGKGYRCRIDVADWNEDGKLDLLVGNFYSHKKPAGGNIWLFLAK